MTFVKNYVPWNKGKKISEETKQKIRENSARYWLDKKLSAEHRKKISLANKGRPSWIKGKHHSEETKRKLSLLFKGKPNFKLRGLTRSAETLRRMSIAQKGKHSWQLNGIPLREWHRRKISLSNMGKAPTNKGIPHSKKTKEKISKSMKIYWNTK